MNLKIAVPVGAAAVGLAILLAVIQSHSATDTATSPIGTGDADLPGVEAGEPPAGSIKVMETGGVLHTIPLEKIRSGGVPKDGIPSIDEPVFVGIEDAAFVEDADMVMGLEISGDARAYPLLILVWHEIVNDIVGGVPVAVTYCPLCYTSQVFERTIDGEAVEFGTTGKLYQSNLLMYDRLTDSYWSQALGTAVKGPLSGSELVRVPFDVMAWGDWKGIHPDTVILSTDTGYARAYGADPYGSYYTDSSIAFPVDNADERMHPKEIIVGLAFEGVSKAYRQADVESSVVINDVVGGTSTLLLSVFAGNARAFDRTVDGEVLAFEYDGGRITDTGSGSEWNYDGLAVTGKRAGDQLARLPIDPGFWFEWVAFHPQTLVYGDE